MFKKILKVALIILIPGLIYITGKILVEESTDFLDGPAALFISSIDREALQSAQRAARAEYDIEDTQINIYTSSFVDINKDGMNDILLQITHDSTCGTSGCIHELYINNTDGSVKKIFAYSAEKIDLMNTYTNGMRDVQINESAIMTWDGSRYVFR